MSFNEPEGKTKEQILAELRTRIEAGRLLLGSIPATEDEMSQAQAQRANWTLANRKWLRSALGDAAGLARLGGTLRENVPLEERTLAGDVREHQEILIAEMAQLEKLARVLSGLNAST